MFAGTEVMKVKDMPCIENTEMVGAMWEIVVKGLPCRRRQDMVQHVAALFRLFRIHG